MVWHPTRSTNSCFCRMFLDVRLGMCLDTAGTSKARLYSFAPQPIFQCACWLDKNVKPHGTAVTQVLVTPPKERKEACEVICPIMKLSPQHQPAYWSPFPGYEMVSCSCAWIELRLGPDADYSHVLGTFQLTKLETLACWSVLWINPLSNQLILPCCHVLDVTLEVVVLVILAPHDDTHVGWVKKQAWSKTLD